MLLEGGFFLDLHSNLKEILDERKLSVRKVSKDIDYRFATVLQMYHNNSKHFPKELIVKLCVYLEVGIDDLLKLK